MKTPSRTDSVGSHCIGQGPEAWHTHGTVSKTEAQCLGPSGLSLKAAPLQLRPPHTQGVGQQLLWTLD